ncbi:MAG: hypothetical protein HZA52_01165 [Planctomycetes bacterium]|nr:hypothetical protein [Planctomycetota bacterium]
MTANQSDGVATADRIRRFELAFAWLATAFALACFARFYVDAGALWRDEINSVNLAATPELSELVRRSEFESFPPPWTLLLRAWTSFAGGSDGSLRFAGVLGGASLLAAVWLAARGLGRAAPVVSLAVLAVQPEVLRWSSTVRAYGLGACLGVLVLLALLRVVEAPTRTRVLLAIVATVASVQVLFQNAVLVAVAVAGAMLLAILRGEARRAWIPVAIGAAGALALLPYLGVIGRVREWSMILEQEVTLASLGDKLVGSFGATSKVALAVWAVLAAAALAAGVASLVRLGAEPERRAARARAIVGAALLVLAPLVVVAFFLRLSYPTESWYYVGLFAFAAASAELALGALAAAKARLAVLALACIALVGGATSAWSAMPQKLTVVDQLAARVTSEGKPGDLVVVNPWFLALTFDRYYVGPLEVLTAPPLEDRTLHRYDLIKRRMLETQVMAPVLERIGAVLAAGGRVWIVGDLNPTPNGLPPLRLGAPPRPGSGWSALADLFLWSTRLGDYLVAHTTTRQLVYAPGETGQPIEATTLYVVQGWRP